MNRPEYFIIENRLLTRYVGPGGDVTVPEGVTGVARNAFRGHVGLRRVTLPEGVRTIGAGAFEGCVFLEAVSLPESLTDVLDQAFARCACLTSAPLPPRLHRLGSEVFADCVSLPHAALPAGLEHVGNGAFRGCAALGAVRLPPRLTDVGDEVFADCAALTDVVLPPHVRRIGVKAFAGCVRLRDLRFPADLRSIGSFAFAGCAALREPLLPEGLTELGDCAFYLCTGLARVVLPPGVEGLGVGVFYGCAGLREAILPEGLTRIGPQAFAVCTALRELLLPESLTNVSDWVFRDCRGLADERGFLIFRGVLLQYFGAPDAAEIPEGVTRIADGAFGPNPRPLRVTLPDSLRSVSPFAFSQCVVLRARRLPPLPDPAVRRVLALVTEEPSPVPPRLRRALRIGRALRPAAELDSPEAREDAAWLSKNAARLCPVAFELPELLHFLCRHRLIRPKDADLYLEEARKRNDPVLTALLLDYENVLGREALEKARERRQRREEAAAEARTERRAAGGPEDGLGGLSFAVPRVPEDFGSRAALGRRLKALGARMAASVSTGSDWLVTDGPEDDPAEAERAAALGVPLLTWREFHDVLRRAEKAQGG